MRHPQLEELSESIRTALRAEVSGGAKLGMLESATRTVFTLECDDEIYILGEVKHGGVRRD